MQNIRENITTFDGLESRNSFDAAMSRLMLSLALVYERTENRNVGAWIRSKQTEFRRSPQISSLLRGLTLNIAAIEAEAERERGAKVYFPTLILPPTSAEDVEADPEAFLREHHMMMTSADYYYASKGARRIRGMNTTAPTFTMLKRLYSEDAQTRIENRRSNTISMRIASWLLNELVECVELRDSLEEDGRALRRDSPRWPATSA